MSPVLESAFAAPNEPGIYRRLSFLPGMREVGAHIADYAAYWRREADDALAQQRPALVALGDSLSQGIGASTPERSYVGLLRRHLEVATGEQIPVLNLSRSGARIDAVLETQLPALDESGVEPLAVVCTIGSNDILRSPRIGATRDAFTQLFERLPAEAIVATLPEKGSAVGFIMNQHIRRLTAETGRPVAEVGRRLTSWRGRVSGDRFHPNDNGYWVWANAFIDALQT